MIEDQDKLDKVLTKWFITNRIIENVTKVLKEPVMDTSPVQKVINALNMLTGCLDPFVKANKSLDDTQLEKFVIYSISWAIGGLYEA